MVATMLHVIAHALSRFAACASALLSAGLMVFGFREAIEKLAIGATAGVTDITTWPGTSWSPWCSSS